MFHCFKVPKVRFVFQEQWRLWTPGRRNELAEVLKCEIQYLHKYQENIKFLTWQQWNCQAMQV